MLTAELRRTKCETYFNVNSGSYGNLKEQKCDAACQNQALLAI